MAEKDLRMYTITFILQEHISDIDEYTPKITSTPKKRQNFQNYSRLVGYLQLLSISFEENQLKCWGFFKITSLIIAISVHEGK